MSRHLYLVKANDQMVSHCTCAESPITFPPQMDCPWCGCGWLFTCINCRKAFTFAKAVEVDESWEELARRDIAGRGTGGSDSNINKWVKFMQSDYLRNVELGHTYVAFDGRVIDIAQARLNFDGWFATHDLPFLPHVKAVKDPTVIRDILANEGYWASHALGENSPSALGKPAVRDVPKSSWWRRFFSR